MKCGGIILCGGKSSRMGLPKATLPFGPELMLQRVVRILSSVVEPIVVVAAAGQELPPLPPSIEVVVDRRQERGPLEGLAVGLAALANRVDAAYATSCDAPFLLPAFVRRVVESLGSHDIAVPKAEGFHHPLAAVYRTNVLHYVERVLDTDRPRPFFLFQHVDTLEIGEAELRDTDPELCSLNNLNRPADYLAALAKAGFTAPPEIAAVLQA